MWSHEFLEHMSWIFWGQLWFNRIKVREFFDSIKTVSAKDDPVVAQWEERNKKRMFEFTEWFEQATLNTEKEDEI